jgi:hypothetical protein
MLIRASGLVVMTSRLQRGDRLFNSGLAHYFFFIVLISEAQAIARTQFNLSLTCSKRERISSSAISPGLLINKPSEFL